MRGEATDARRRAVGVRRAIYSYIQEMKASGAQFMAPVITDTCTRTLCIRTLLVITSIKNYSNAILILYSTMRQSVSNRWEERSHNSTSSPHTTEKKVQKCRQVRDQHTCVRLKVESYIIQMESGTRLCVAQLCYEMD